MVELEGNQPVKVKTEKGVFRCHLDQLHGRQTTDPVGGCSTESNADRAQEFLPNWLLEEPVQNTAEAAPACFTESFEPIGEVSF